jgi:hypothetical protein
LAFGLAIEALLVIVGGWQTDDVVAVEETRPIPFTQSEKVIPELGQPGSEVRSVGQLPQMVS